MSHAAETQVGKCDSLGLFVVMNCESWLIWLSYNRDRETLQRAGKRSST